jgi:hypothetical protein
MYVFDVARKQSSPAHEIRAGLAQWPKARDKFSDV